MQNLDTHPNDSAARLTALRPGRVDSVSSDVNYIHIFLPHFYHRLIRIKKAAKEHNQPSTSLLQRTPETRLNRSYGNFLNKVFFRLLLQNHRSGNYPLVDQKLSYNCCPS